MNVNPHIRETTQSLGDELTTMDIEDFWVCIGIAAALGSVLTLLLMGVL